MLIKIQSCLIIFLIIITTTVSGETSKAKPLPNVQLIDLASITKETNHFYLLSKEFLIPNIYGNPNEEALPDYTSWLQENSKWKTVDVSTLKKIGINENDKIQYIDFETGIKKEYIIKKKVHLAMIGDESYGEPETPDINRYRTFYILLKDDIGTTIHPEKPAADKITGFAYRGLEYSLKSAPYLSHGFKSIDSKNEDVSKILAGRKKFSLDKAYSTTIKGHQFYRFEGNEGSAPATGLALKRSENKFEMFSQYWIDADYQPSFGYFQYGDYIEGFDLILFEPEGGADSCYKLHLINSNRHEVYKLSCNLGSPGGC